MAQSDLVIRARRGEAEAIAQLIGTSLAARGIAVRVEWQGNDLYVLLEGQVLPSAQSLVPNLRQGFERLAIRRAIATVYVYARRPQQTVADWADTFTLTPILDRAPSPPVVMPAPPALDRESQATAEPLADPAPPAVTPAEEPEPIRADADADSLPPLPSSPDPAVEPPLVPTHPTSVDTAPESAPEDSPLLVSPLPSAAPSDSATGETPAPTFPTTYPSLSSSPPAPPDDPAPTPSQPPYLSDTALLTLAHLAPLLGYLVWVSNTWIGLSLLLTGSFLLPWRVFAPLALLLIHGKEDAFVQREAQEALNFQLSLALYWVVTFSLMWLLIGFLLVLPLAFFEVVCIVRAAVQTSQNKPVRYPLTIRFIR